MEVLHYLDRAGHDLFQRWLDKLKDRQARIATSGGLTGWRKAIWAIANFAVTRCGNCAVNYWRAYQQRSGASHGKR